MNLHAIKTSLTNAEKAVYALNFLSPGEYDLRIENDTPYWIVRGSPWPTTRSNWNVLDTNYFVSEYNRLMQRRRDG